MIFTFETETTENRYIGARPPLSIVPSHLHGACTSTKYVHFFPRHTWTIFFSLCQNSHAALASYLSISRKLVASAASSQLFSCRVLVSLSTIVCACHSSAIAPALAPLYDLFHAIPACSEHSIHFCRRYTPHACTTIRHAIQHSMSIDTFKACTHSAHSCQICNVFIHNICFRL